VRVENLQMFILHVEPNAQLRRHRGSGEQQGVCSERTMYADLQDLLTTSRERFWSPSLLRRRYTQLRPFTDANRRSGRALWLWQFVQTRPRALRAAASH
jgi:hypothetical protein